MGTHIDLDPVLIDQVVELGRFRSKKAAVHAALSEFLKTMKRQQLLALRGQVPWQADLTRLRADRVVRSAKRR